MADREIYLRTPLALVVAEIRHPAALPLSDSARAQLKTRLAPLFPLAKPVQRMTVTPTQTAVAVSTDARFMPRDRTSSVTFRDDVIVVETTRYERRRVLRNMMHEAVLARQETAPADGVERLGILIDLDCYWTPSGGTPPLEWDLIDSRFDQASLAAYDLFEQLITDKLREEVLRHEG